MSIIRAFVLPHPPLAIPTIGRGREEEIKDTLTAMTSVAREIAGICPDTIVFLTPHGTAYADYIHISPGAGAVGDLSQFGCAKERFSLNYDQELVAAIVASAEKDGIPAGTMGERNAALDHGVTVPMWYINQQYRDYQAVRIASAGLEREYYYRLGQSITQAAQQLKRRVVVVASGDLSHKLTTDAPYGYEPEALVFDTAITDVMASGDFGKLLALPEDLREKAGECGYCPLLIMAGLFDRTLVEVKLLSYEGPFGVGYAVADVKPLESDEKRNFLDRYMQEILQKARDLQQNEDIYRTLARKSLEYTIKNKKALPLPNGLPDELLLKQAGAFVTLYKHGSLRGCIGTIMPVTDCLAQEIIRNAVSAGLHDTRFDQITAAELPYLVYSVDVLGQPEEISGLDQLDVKRYGVIVTSGNKRGLLLPNLDGIDTVEEQVAIARRKGGIGEKDKVVLERFEVTRYC
ncbi:MAG: AmmeMemoRadiSam system protein A [Lachnospiraceae bacterium]|jgi:AmmeMemoRadiSam system protein A|nr:AmmeMemoRadiSam system protein A [Lachnospiraceae bacterium]